MKRFVSTCLLMVALTATCFAQPRQIWDDWLTVASIPSAAPAIIPSGLVGWWKFDEGTGSYAVDYYGTNAALLSSTTWTNGFYNKALYFDGLFSFAYNTNNNPAFRIPYITIAAYIYVPVGPNGGVAISVPYSTSWNPPYSSYYIGITTGYQVECSLGINHTQRVFDTVATFPSNTWLHCTLTYNGSNMILYTNGVSCTNYAISGTITYGTGVTNEVCFGRRGRNMAGSNFKGRVDNVFIFNRALSQSEVSQLYSNQPQ